MIKPTESVLQLWLQQRNRTVEASKTKQWTKDSLAWSQGFVLLRDFARPARLAISVCHDKRRDHKEQENGFLHGTPHGDP